VQRPPYNAHMSSPPRLLYFFLIYTTRRLGSRHFSQKVAHLPLASCLSLATSCEEFQRSPTFGGQRQSASLCTLLSTSLTSNTRTLFAVPFLDRTIARKRGSLRRHRREAEPGDAEERVKRYGQPFPKSTKTIHRYVVDNGRRVGGKIHNLISEKSDTAIFKRIFDMSPRHVRIALGVYTISLDTLIRPYLSCHL
jgi:hypothetical protein